jgi:hypothetical protein
VSEFEYVALTNLVFCEVNGGFFCSFLSDGFDEQARRADVVLVVDAESRFVFREHHVLRPATSY